MKRWLLISALTLGGCSAADGYRFVQSAGESKADCEKRQTDAAERRCEAPYAMPYEAYVELRDATLRTPEPSPPEP
jgi:hypothetical protein